MAAQDDSHIWGNYTLPLVLKALGIADDTVRGVTLHFEYGRFATATIHRQDAENEVRTLHTFGIDSQSGVGKALRAPRALNALTICIEVENFVTVECRYFPLEASIANFAAALRTPNEPTQ